MKILKYFLNVVIAILILFFLFGFIISLYYSNRPLPEIIFKNAPEYNQISKKFSYISGGIVKPGVYEINESTRIIDLINLAGGFLKEVDHSSIAEKINLSKIVQDEEHIFIPIKNYSLLPRNNQSKLISLNNSSLDQLVSLPGIGPSTAQKIINNRPYSSIEDLLLVDGIGQKTLNSIKDLISP